MHDYVIRLPRGETLPSLIAGNSSGSMLQVRDYPPHVKQMNARCVIYASASSDYADHVLRLYGEFTVHVRLSWD